MVMASKPKKTKAAPAAVDTKAKAETDASASTEATPTNAAATGEGSSSTVAATPAPTASAAATAPPAVESSNTFPDEVVNNLTGMGFPEAEVRHCLRAAHGSPDVAVEFLTNGIPDGAAQLVQASGGAASPAASSGAAPLANLRRHPQFNALRRLVQSDPGMLQQVLTQIGQQDPVLLREINGNQQAFLTLMNEPIVEGETAAPADDGAAAAGLGGIMNNAAQMNQMINAMSDTEVAQMAQMMGVSVQQLRTTAQMIGQMPEEQLQGFVQQAMGSGAGGAAPSGGGQQVLRLTEEEMAAVDRLAEMGFDKSEAAQAFLACDKNEALAANLLMDSMADGGGGAFFGGDGPSGGGDNADNNNDDDDAMYD